MTEGKSFPGAGPLDGRGTQGAGEVGTAVPAVVGGPPESMLRVKVKERGPGPVEVRGTRVPETGTLPPELDPGDPTAPPGTYQHSLSRRRAAEAEAAQQGRKLRWKTPLREGFLVDAFECDSITQRAQADT